MLALQVMPYSMGCATPLSNFEANQNYKDVSDPAGASLLLLTTLRCPGTDAPPPPRPIGDGGPGATVIVSFPLRERLGVAVLAWTTTPWTLPSNLGLCVHPTFDYVQILGACVYMPTCGEVPPPEDPAYPHACARTDKATGHRYILLEKRLDALYKNPTEGTEYTVEARMQGETLVGLHYEPLFDYFYEVRAHAHTH
jgi:isoleucyl-tRNA synthetase